VSSTEPSRQLTVEVDNNIKLATLSSSIHRLRCVSGNSGVIWETLLNSRINIVAVNRLTPVVVVVVVLVVVIVVVLVVVAEEVVLLV